MTKKALVLTSAVAAALAFHACTLPSSVEIKTEKLKFAIPTKTGSVNITNLLHHFLDETFNQNGIELYDMRNYTDAQAFVVGYTYSMTPDFDPQKILQDIKNQINQITNINPDEIKPIDQEIVIPQIEWTKIEDTYPFYMDTLFQSMKEEINDTSMPPTVKTINNFPLDSTLTDELASSVFDWQNIMAFNFKNGAANFDSVAVATGTIKLQISLEPISPTKIDNLDGLEVLIKNITLIEDGLGTSIGNPVGLPEVVLNEDNNFSDYIEYDLANTNISREHPPRFSIGNIDATYNGAESGFVSFDFVIQPTLENIELRGAEHLRIGTMKPDLPPEFKEIFDKTFDMSMMDGTDGLLDMEIGSGMLNIKSSTPERPLPDNMTYCEGLKITYTLCIKQKDTEYSNTNFPGLNGDPWTITIQNGSGEFDLAGETFNGNPLKIITQDDPDMVGNNYSYVTIEAANSNGISFKLYGDDLTNMTLPIDVNLDMSISELAVVHWKLENENGTSLLPPIEDIELDFGNISGGKNVAEYIESISFESINLDINFTKLPEAFKNRLAVFIDCHDLGFDEEPLTLGLGSNSIKSEDITLFLSDDNDNPKKLQIHAGIAPVIDGDPDPSAKYIEIGPLELNQNGETKLKLAGEIDFDYKWSEVKVNLQKTMQELYPDNTGLLKGHFPGAAEEPIDLYGYAKEYMYGFTLPNVQTRVFLGGPTGLMESLSPALDMGLTYKKRINPNDPDDEKPENWEDAMEHIFNDTLTVHNAGGLPALPGINSAGEYVYDKPNLSSMGAGISLVNLSTVIADMPNDLRFNYEMILPTEFPITPEMIDEANPGESNISVFFVMMIPLELQGMPGAYFSFPSDMFGDGAEQDLFGRKSTDGTHPDEDSIFTDINVKSLGLAISFDKALFKNGTLHLDKNKKLFPNGLNLGSDNSLKFAVNAKDFKIIRENMIYPDIKIEFKKGTTLAIPRNPMPTKITITASGSYKMDLPDFTVEFKDAEDTDL